MGSAFKEANVTRASLEESGGRNVDVLHLIAPCRLSSDGPTVVLVDGQGSE